jgi:3-mercaptopropionate dioxygenase
MVESADAAGDDLAPLLGEFIHKVDHVVASYEDEHEIAERVAEPLSALLASGYRLPEPFTRPAKDHHVNYPLHISRGGGWSLASVVWNMGQSTPVHGHETWGAVGVRPSCLLVSRCSGVVR